MRPCQANLFIYDLTFNALQNGKKIFEKEVYLQADMKPTKSVTR